MKWTDSTPNLYNSVPTVQTISHGPCIFYDASIDNTNGPPLCTRSIFETHLTAC